MSEETARTHVWKGPTTPKPHPDAVWHFTKGWMVPFELIALEREACAKIADQIDSPKSEDGNFWCAYIASSIRSRSQGEKT